MTIVLASQSTYRSELLKRLGMSFETVAPMIDESPRVNEAGEQLAVRLAAAKAQKVSEQYSNSVIIGSDQVCVCGEQMLGKPKTAEVAKQQLSLCSGQRVVFFTGLSVIDQCTGIIHQGVDQTVVDFRKLSEQEISAYIALDSPLNCAGSFKMESLGVTLFKSIKTNDPTAVIGLPLILLSQFLRASGVCPLQINSY